MNQNCPGETPRRKLPCGWGSLGLWFVLAATTALAAPTDLDLKFGTNGKVITEFGAADGGRSLALQADGKILLAGHTFQGGGDFALARYLPNGQLDLTFDMDGRVNVDFGGYEEGYSVAVQPDGKILLGGYTEAGGDFALARLLPTGAPDPDFDTDGRLTTDFGGYEVGSSLAIQGDGKILVGGYRQPTGGSDVDFALARYLPDGKLDPSFSMDGKLTTPFGKLRDASHALAVQADGKILLGGLSAHADFTTDFALARYLPDGTLDPAFGAGGKQTLDFGNASDEIRSIKILADGKILVGGTAIIAGVYDFALAQYLPDGTLDPAFGTDGKITTDFAGSSDYGFSVAVLPNGKILQAGYSNIFGVGGEFGLARFLPNGTLDPSFGTEGKHTTGFGGSEDEARAVAVQTDGKVVLGGTSTGQGWHFGLLRYLGDPTRDPALPAERSP